VPEYTYYVADGSMDDGNKKTFEKYCYDNIFYKFYGQDNSIEDYLNKLYTAISSADTEYVMLCDNDDFINYTGITECLKVLDGHPDFTCAGGDIFSVFENRQNKHLYNLPIPFYSTRAIHNISQPFEAFKEIRREYKYVWYAVYRKDSLVRIWKQIIEFGLRDLFLLEMLQVDLALNDGKYYHIDNNHYIRLMNSGSSGAASRGEAYHKRIFFDKAYRDELHRLNEFYTQLYNQDIREIQKAQESFYIWYFKAAPRIKISFLRKIHGAILRVPFFSIKTCIAALNTYLKIKRGLNTFSK
jgi:glycosyltransferase domain-containing protein